MNISMVMIDPMIGTKQHRAGGAIYALHTYMKVNNKYINDINTEIFNFNSLYKGAANFYATAIVKSNPDIVAFSTYCWNIDIVIDFVSNTISFAGFSKGTKDFKLDKKIDYMGVRLKPSIFYLLFNVAADKVMDNEIAFSAIEKEDNIDINKILNESF